MHWPAGSSVQDAYNPSPRDTQALTCWRRRRYGLMRVECSTKESTARLPYILTYSNLAVRIPLVYKTFRRAGAGGHWSRAACARRWRELEWSPPPVEGVRQGRQTLLLSTAYDSYRVLEAVPLCSDYYVTRTLYWRDNTNRLRHLDNNKR